MGSHSSLCDHITNVWVTRLGALIILSSLLPKSTLYLVSHIFFCTTTYWMAAESVRLDCFNTNSSGKGTFVFPIQVTNIFVCIESDFCLTHFLLFLRQINVQNGYCGHNDTFKTVLCFSSSISRWLGPPSHISIKSHCRQSLQL